jgi:hypothetical protein
MPCIPATCTRNPHGNGTFFQCDAFRQQPETDTYLCPDEKTLKRKARLKKDKSIIYLANAKDCGSCSLKHRCTTSIARRVSRHMFEDALTRMNERATATAMRLRRSVVEHPFAYHQVPHLRPSTPPPARMGGSSYRANSRSDGLQPEKDGKCTRKYPLNAGTSEKLNETEPRQLRSKHRQNLKPLTPAEFRNGPGTPPAKKIGSRRRSPIGIRPRDSFSVVFLSWPSTWVPFERTEASSLWRSS